MAEGWNAPMQKRSSFVLPGLNGFHILPPECYGVNCFARPREAQPSRRQRRDSAEYLRTVTAPRNGMRMECVSRNAAPRVRRHTPVFHGRIHGIPARNRSFRVGGVMFAGEFGGSGSIDAAATLFLSDLAHHPVGTWLSRCSRPITAFRASSVKHLFRVRCPR